MYITRAHGLNAFLSASICVNGMKITAFLLYIDWFNQNSVIFLSKYRNQTMFLNRMANPLEQSFPDSKYLFTNFITFY